MTHASPRSPDRDDDGHLLVACALNARAETTLAQLDAVMRAADPSITADQVVDIVFHVGLTRCAALFTLHEPTHAAEDHDARERQH